MEEMTQIEGLMAEVAMADAAERRLTAQMDAELTRVRERYAEALEAELEALEKELFGEAATNYARAAEIDRRKTEAEERLLEIYEEIGV